MTGKAQRLTFVRPSKPRSCLVDLINLAVGCQVFQDHGCVQFSDFLRLSVGKANARKLGQSGWIAKRTNAKENSVAEVLTGAFRPTAIFALIPRAVRPTLAKNCISKDQDSINDSIVSSYLPSSIFSRYQGPNLRVVSCSVFSISDG